jgi:hypothetical protein
MVIRKTCDGERRGLRQGKERSGEIALCAAELQQATAQHPDLTIIRQPPEPKRKKKKRPTHLGLPTSPAVGQESCRLLEEEMCSGLQGVQSCGSNMVCSKTSDALR